MLSSGYHFHAQQFVRRIGGRKRYLLRFLPPNENDMILYVDYAGSLEDAFEELVRLVSKRKIDPTGTDEPGFRDLDVL